MGGENKFTSTVAFVPLDSQLDMVLVKSRKPHPGATHLDLIIRLSDQATLGWEWKTEFYLMQHHVGVRDQIMSISAQVALNTRVFL